MSSLQSRYEALTGSNPIAPAFLRRLETELGVSLPASFVAAAAFFDGTGMALPPLHPMDGGASGNVLAETQRLRGAVNLPRRFLVLAEPSEGLVVLDCEGGQVIWCDASDVPGLEDGRFARQSDTWAQFSDFVEYLVEQEEAWGAS
ncbi:MAG: hypothetical protein ACREH4_09910 [Vitreimonas sp.]